MRNKANSELKRDRFLRPLVLFTTILRNSKWQVFSCKFFRAWTFADGVNYCRGGSYAANNHAPTSFRCVWFLKLVDGAAQRPFVSRAEHDSGRTPSLIHATVSRIRPAGTCGAMAVPAHVVADLDVVAGRPAGSRFEPGAPDERV
jgi:hypothetical protein